MKRSSQDLLIHFHEKLANHKLAVTPQRIAIYKELLENQTHPSAKAIYKSVKNTFHNISFDTVYRTLLSFSEIGILNLVEGYGEEKRFDVNVHSHHHLRCIKCHEITDFFSEAYDDLPVPREVAKKFKIIKKRVVLEGVCDKCKSKI